jgi:hypothetical protein
MLKQIFTSMLVNKDIHLSALRFGEYPCTFHLSFGGTIRYGMVWYGMVLPGFSSPRALIRLACGSLFQNALGNP